MSLTDLLPEVRALPHPDKLRLLRFLADELARDSGVPKFEEDSVFPVWTPFGQHEAARALHELLQSEETTP